MYISRFRVTNFKSFRESPELSFTPGFNIVSGQNNAGKTALLEAMALDFFGKPHRSLRSMPARDTVPEQTSSIDVSFTLSTSEVRELMLSFRGQHYQITRPVIGSDYARKIGYDADTPAAALRLVNAVLSEKALTFRLRRQAEQSRAASWLMMEAPSYGLYEPQRPRPGNYAYCTFAVDENGTPSILNTGGLVAGPVDLGQQLAGGFERHVFRFSAERMNVGRSAHGANSVLNRNASNLPEVLGQLQHNKVRFDELNEELNSILPQVRWVSVRAVDHGNVEIVVWPHDPASKRDDLAVPLLESGTGIAQVLAILYVVMTSERGQTIIIDEPQSFLHPGAARKLVDFLRLYPQHQFIIATHSAAIISAANPRTITLAQLVEAETRLQQLDAKMESGIRTTLTELGVRLADLYGADNILWVEGRTEEECFPVIVEKLLHRRLMGTQILGIRETGDLEGRDAKRVFQIYRRLAEGASLLPPALGFVLDVECRRDEAKTELQRLSGDRVTFLSRRMYENYLLNGEAVAAVANSIEGFRDPLVTPEEIRRAIEVRLNRPEFYCGGRIVPVEAERVARVDGGAVLEGIFNELSEARVPYQKVQHGKMLTEWFVANRPDDLAEVRDLLARVLG